MFILLCFTMLTACGTLTTYELSYDAKKRLAAYNDAHYCEQATTTYSLPYVYSGVRGDFLYLFRPAYCDWAHGEAGCFNNCCFMVSTPLAILDLPFSLIADTLMLPRTLYLQHKDGKLIDPPYFEIAKNRRSREKNYEPYEDYAKALAVLPKYYSGGDDRVYYLSRYEHEIHDLAQYYMKHGRIDEALGVYEMLISIVRSRKVTPTHSEYFYELKELCSKASGTVAEKCRDQVDKAKIR